MKRYLIPAIVIASLAFATTAEAGPIRGLLGKLNGKPKAVAAKLVKCAGGVCR